jgi:hypothetical protein
MLLGWVRFAQYTTAHPPLHSWGLWYVSPNLVVRLGNFNLGLRDRLLRIYMLNRHMFGT